jgi:hypothetical protein
VMCDHRRSITEAELPGGRLSISGRAGNGTAVVLEVPFSRPPCTG